MLSPLHQIEPALSALTRNMSAITRTARSMARLSDAAHALPAVVTANDTLAQLIPVAGVARAVSGEPLSQGTTSGAAVNTQPDVPVNDGTYNLKHITGFLEQALHRVADIAQRQARAVPGTFAAASARLLEASIGNLGTGLELAGRSLSSGQLGNLPTFFKSVGALAGASGSQLRSFPVEIGVKRVTGVAGTTSKQAARASTPEAPAASRLLSKLRTWLSSSLVLSGSSARTMADPVRESPSVVAKVSGGRLTRPQFADMHYLRASTLSNRLSPTRGFIGQPLTAYTERPSTVARVMSSIAAAFALKDPYEFAGLAHASPALLRAPRQPQLLAASKQNSLRWPRPMLDRRDQQAPATPFTAAPAPPPSTINVAINVTGVTNGDEFVRRHGYAIAQVLDQVLERRARCTF